MPSILRLISMTLLFALCAKTVHAIVNPASGSDWEDANANVFLDGEITRVDVTIDPDDFQVFLDDPQTDETRPVTVRWKNSVIDETHQNVAFRVRGNTSRNAARKSWKLDFRRNVDGRDFHGLEEVNLNGGNNDPSLIRTILAWEIVRVMGISGSRTHLVALYINGTFWSIQTHVEHIDEEFVENYFTDKDGNLYKCLYQGAQADLSFVNGEDYTNYAGGEVYRETNNNNDPNRDYSDIADFVRLINFSSDAELLESLEHSFDIDTFLRSLAVDVGVGSWDDYWYGSNNYYLYFNRISDRFQWIPYDYDNSFGIDFFNTDWSTRSFDGWGDGGFGSTPAPLVEAVFSHSEWRRQFRRYLLQVADILQDAGLRQKISEWHSLVTPYMDGTIESGGVVGGQPYFPDAINQPAEWNGPEAQDGHRMGVIPYMDARAASLRNQVENFFPISDLPTVRINEAMPSNRDAVEDEYGDNDDWLELHNFGTEPIDVSGWYVTDALTSPTKYMIPATTIIPAGGFLVIWCDGQPEQGGFHAPFRLGNSGDEHLGLYHNMTDGRILIDYMNLPTTPTDLSYGRYPDGEGPTQQFDNPTPGAPNDPTNNGGGDPRDPPKLYINEFLADNGSAEQDEAGQNEDWVEIYNDEDTEVDLSGLHLTDDPGNPTKWQFPEGTTIAAKGFLLVWADEDPGDGPLHADFKLSKNGEVIGLFDNDENQNQLIDSLAFGPQTEDVTSGRLPDGSANVVTLGNRTPGASNGGAGGSMDSWTLD